MFAESVVLCLYREPHSPKLISPILHRPCGCFHGVTPCVQKSEVGLSVVQWSIPEKVIGSPFFVVLLLPWFSDTTGGFFIWSDYRCMMVSAGKVSSSLTRGAVVPLIRRYHGAFSYGPVVDVQ